MVGPPTEGSSTRPPSSNDAGWTSSANGYTSDNLYATTAPGKNKTKTLDLGTFGFDSTVPTNATITGVTVSVEWKVSTTASIATLGARAYVNGSPVGSEFVNTAEPTSDTTQTFSVSGLTRAQLLDGVLEVRVRASRGNTNTAFTTDLDAVSVTVDYSAPGSLTLTTNANGNLVAKGADTFIYDQANRLISATVAGVTETYAYDGDGVRFSRQVGPGPVIRYVSDINTGLPLTIDDGTRKYVWGLGLAYAASGSSVEVYHTDRLGSVRAIIDATGVVNATYRTDEYGVPTETTGSSTQPFGFTGEPRDASGLSYLRARYYDASLGRFVGRDRWAGVRGAPGTLNRYGYVEGNPATWSDPTGMAGPGVACLTPVTIGFCVEAGSAVVTGILGVAGAIIGLALGEAVFDEVRRDPTWRPWTPPAPNPDVGRAIVELHNSLKLNDDFGLFGMRDPEFCKRHKMTCQLIGLLGIVGVGTLLTKYGDLTAMENYYWSYDAWRMRMDSDKPKVLGGY